MVKNAELRKRKYDASLDPEKIARNLARLKPGMVEQESVYLAQIANVERKVKDVCEAAGVASFLVAQYINVGRQCYSLAKRFSGATRDGEAQNVVDHWAARGLNGPLLQAACVAGGCHPTAPPGPPVTPTKCYFGAVHVQHDKELTFYFALNGDLKSSIEPQHQTAVVEGKFTALKINVWEHDNPWDTIITLRRNGANTALTVTIPAMTKGIFTTEADVEVDTDDLMAFSVTKQDESEWGLIGFLALLEFEPA